MKLGTVRISGLRTDEIIETLNNALPQAELQDKIEELLEDYGGVTFGFTEELLRHIAECLTEEEDL